MPSTDRLLENLGIITADAQKKVDRFRAMKNLPERGVSNFLSALIASHTVQIATAAARAAEANEFENWYLVALKDLAESRDWEHRSTSEGINMDGSANATALAKILDRTAYFVKLSAARNED